MVFVSALRGQGREELMEAVINAYSQWCTTVSASQFRHWLPKVRTVVCCSKQEGTPGIVQAVAYGTSEE